MLLAQALYPAMLERGSGHLVFVASLSGKAASPHSSIYNATKFGLRGFALGLRADLDPQGVGVSLVSPGLHPRRRDVRRVGGADPGRARHLHPERGRRRGGAGRSSANKVEVVVAPLQQRVAGPLRAGQPRASRCGRPSGAAGQKAAAEVAAGHSKDKR